MWVRYTICYLNSIMIFGAYCVGKVQVVFDNGGILCR